MFTNWNDLENKFEHFEVPLNGVNATKIVSIIQDILL